jgi:hypothetical protein
MSEPTLRDLNLRLIGVAALLQEALLAVPLYQRSYSWEAEQVAAYWRDLQAAMSAGARDYFLGTVVLADERALQTGRDRRITVVDGQQRLATTSILLCVMRDALVQTGDQRGHVIEANYLSSSDLRTGERIPRLALNDEDASFYERHILNHSPAQAAQEDIKFGSNRRLLDARATLVSLVDEEMKTVGPRWQDRLFDWVEFLQDAVRVISIRVESEADAFLIFETLNDRGLGLNIADLLKNHLISLSGTPAISRDEVHADWMSMQSSFSPEADDANLVTTFIRHFWSSLHGATRERELYASLKRRIRSAEQAAELVTDIAESAPNYAALLDAGHVRWSELEVPAALVETVLRFGLEQPRTLLLAAMDCFEPDELRRLLTASVSWMARGLIVGGIGGGTSERYYANAAKAVRRKEVATTEEVAEILAPNIPPDDAFRGTFELKRVNSPRLTKYYLAAIEKHLRRLPDPSIVSDGELGEVNLFPVLPRRASADIWTEFTKDNINQMSLRLGNQFLLTQPIAPGNATPSQRVSHMQAAGGLLSRVIRGVDEWSPWAIDTVQKSYAEISVDVWAV